MAAIWPASNTVASVGARRIRASPRAWALTSSHTTVPAQKPPEGDTGGPAPDARYDSRSPLVGA